MPQPRLSARHPVSQRLRAVMSHTRLYAFDGISRLARDVGVSPSAISRLLSGDRHPSFALMLAITQAFEQELGKPLDPRERMTFSGQFPTASVCALCECRGCLPEAAYLSDGTIDPVFAGVVPGQWSGDFSTFATGFPLVGKEES